MVVLEVLYLVAVGSNVTTDAVLKAMAMFQQGGQEVQVTPWWTGASMTEEMILVGLMAGAKEGVKAKAIWLGMTGCGRVLSRSGPYGMSSSGQSGLN